MCSPKTVLFAYGRGGHTAQMNRLLALLEPLLPDMELVSLSDNVAKPDWSGRHYRTGEFRSKHSVKAIFFNLGPFLILGSLFKIWRHHRVIAVVSTGPGIGLLAAVFFKLTGAKIIHLETWSRFKTRSLTGRLMYWISDRFYVQNKSLMIMYPKAIYSGLL